MRFFTGFVVKWGSLRELGQSLERLKSILVSTFESVPSISRLEITSGPSIGAAFEINHDVGSVPVDFLQSGYANGVVWATAQDRAQWTSKRLTLRASVASTRFNLYLIKES